MRFKNTRMWPADYRIGAGLLLLAGALFVWTEGAFWWPGPVWLLVPAGLVLTWLASIDAKIFRLPDALTLPLLGAGLVLAATSRGLSVHDSIMGATAGYAALYAIRIMWLRMRGIEGLGLGDAKLFAALGAWTGIWALPTIALIASLAGLVFAVAMYLTENWTDRGNGGSRREIAFGPFLAAGAIWAVTFGPLGM